MKKTNNARKVVLALMGAAALSGMAAAPASAGVLVASASDCGDPPLSQPFRPWGDGASYFLAPGGRFEGTPAGWQLGSGVRVVADNEPWKVSGAGTRALHIPAGATVTSPTICVGVEEPTLRFFARRTSGLPLLASLAVSVQTETSLGLVATVPVNAVALGDSRWSPTARMLIVTNLLPLLPGEKTPIRVKLTSVLGDFRIDDFYVDPMRVR